MTEETTNTLAGSESPAVAEEAKATEAVNETDTVESVAKEAGEGSDTEEKPSETAKQEEQPDKPKRNSAKERIQELARKNRELQEQIDALTAAKPKESDFDDPADFDDARLKAAVKDARADELKAERKKVAAELAAQADEAWNTQIEDARTRYTDFDAVVSNPKLPITNEMAEVIKDSDNGADVAYWLGKNPAEAQRIAQLPPIAAARELGRIEARLTPQPRRISSAPPPVETVGSRGGSNNDPDKMSVDQLLKHLKT